LCSNEDMEEKDALFPFPAEYVGKLIKCTYKDKRIYGIAKPPRSIFWLCSTDPNVRTLRLVEYPRDYWRGIYSNDVKLIVIE
jgi:hypothetical protein